MLRASYAIVHDVPGEALVIRDLNSPGNPTTTITNDAEAVVSDLVSKGKLPSGRKLFYYDTDGNKDELRVFNGKFVGFRMGAR